MIRATRVAASLLVLGAAGSAFAQDPPNPTPTPPSAQHEKNDRSTGLPSGVDWTFNFDAGFAAFSFLNSLFTNPRDEPSGDLGDNWFEGYVRPSLSGEYTFGGGSVVHGAVSVVGERTYGGAPALVGEDFSSFGPDDLWIGWRDNALSLTVGRARYQLGHGFLLYDGTAEGGSRGGYWSNARTAFEFASIIRFAPGSHTADAFYLDKDELPESETGSRLWGANYEFRAGETSTFGATYMRWAAHADVEPGRDGLNVLNLRAYTAPIPAHPGITIEAEYAHEANGDALTSTAWSLQGAYEIGTAWTPTVSYRYAFFEGDDPDTPANEAFDPLFLSFYDWGTWWQGEIAGEYFLSNSNLKSHQVRVDLAPGERLDTGLIFYRFFADYPASFGEGVTSKNIAFEINAYADWKLNTNFTLSIVGGFANPGEAVRQLSGRTANFGLGLLSLAYTF